jgi:hypothetical protein
MPAELTLGDMKCRMRYLAILDHLSSRHIDAIGQSAPRSA